MHASRRVLSWLVLLGVVPGGAAAQEDRTPRAGVAYVGSLFGKPVDVAPRDRTRVTEIFAGAQAIPGGPEEKTLGAEGVLFLWRSLKGGDERLRAELLGIYDDVRWNRKLVPGLEAVLTFQNTTLPWARSEYASGVRIASEELKWHSLRAGLGLGTYRRIAPGLQDNAFETSLAYEPGLLFFGRGADTAPSFTLPTSAYEGRLHARVRADAFERNLLELPHAGWAAGLDAIAARRGGWSDWGGGPTGPHAAAESDAWSSAAGYALAALPVPFLASERHRLIASVYAGTGSDLDRFSAFRLSGGSNAGDFESLSRPVLPAAGFDEVASRGYVVASVEYRFEALFFLFLHARGTFARVDRIRAAGDGLARSRTDSPGGFTVGLTSGFLFSSAIEIFFSRNVALESESGGVFSPGRNAVYVSFTKSF
jgi:hypothetical protein